MDATLHQFPANRAAPATLQPAIDVAGVNLYCPADLCRRPSGACINLPNTETTNCDAEAAHSNEDDPRPGVSVILFEDAIRQGKLIADARRLLNLQETPVEFFVVTGSDTRLTPLSGSKAAVSVQSVEAAIRLSKHETIAIADSVYRFDDAHWNVIKPTSESQAIRSWSFAPSLAPGSRRVLAWFYCLMVRILLGVRKNRITPGLVVFPKPLLGGIDLHRIDSKHPDSVSQLMAVAKSRGIPLEEHRCSVRQSDTLWSKTNSGEPHFPKSKSIKASIRHTIQFWFGELAFPARLQTKSRRAQKYDWNSIARDCLILIVAAVLLFANSGYPLFEPDETRNAQLALNIVESGNWLSLSLFDEPYWDKPPLLAWLTAVSYTCFGVSEWSTRLPSLVSSLLLIAFLLNAGTKLLGSRVAAMGCAALLLAWGFSFQSRYVTMDALLMLCTTVTTLGIAVGIRRRNQRTYRPRWLIASGIALGLGILAKGPVCAVLAIPPVIVWAALNAEITRKARKEAFKRVAIPAAIIAAPWFIITTILHPEFAYHFLWKHHVVRFSDAFNHEEPFWYYAPIIWLFMFPASILLPRVIHAMASQKQKHCSFRTPVHGLLVLSSIWIIGFFSFSQCKLPAYIFPVFPMIALLTGAVLDIDLARSPETRGRIDRLPKRIAIGLVILTTIVAIVSWSFGAVDSTSTLVAAATVLASIALAILFSTKRTTGRKKAWLATAAIGLLFVFLGVNHLVPAFSQHRSISSAISGEQGRESVPVVYFGRDSFASDIYLPHRTVVQFDEESLESLEEFMLRNPQASIVASDENLERVKTVLGENASVEKGAGRHVWKISLTPERLVARPLTDKLRK